MDALVILGDYSLDSVLSPMQKFKRCIYVVIALTRMKYVLHLISFNNNNSFMVNSWNKLVNGEEDDEDLE